MTQPAKPTQQYMWLNSHGDLAFCGEIKPYIWRVVEVVKQTKSGLYQVKTVDGKSFSVGYRNLTKLEEYDPNTTRIK